jgi:hypothetical protein
LIELSMMMTASRAVETNVGGGRKLHTFGGPKLHTC